MRRAWLETYSIESSSEIRERKQAAQAAYEEVAAARAGAGGARRERDGRRRPTALEGESVRAPEHAQPAAGRARRGANREAILAAVGERPGATAREIADLTGIARNTVASTLTRLAADGVLERSELPAGGVGFRSARAAAAD